ncbi:MAG: response regulator transcription factor [Defluviitaleaceae bacterium]|nr:response regulator transcription factor [Defluviitaleaceae bacterium]
MKYDCLLVEDDKLLGESTCEYFNAFGIKTHRAENYQNCMEFLYDHEADLMLLDINLPDGTGFDICRKVRETSEIPILFISARTGDTDQLLALSIGGDDYIQKPYSLSVLLAKVKVILSRYRKGTEDIFAHDNLQVDFKRKEATIAGNPLALKGMEYKLLAYFVKNRNREITKDELFKGVWEDSQTSDNTLNVHIRRLREKIESNPNEPRYIQSIWGRGYIFNATEVAAQ